jgi:predicted GIY-YIG superfamily endonuclease
MSWCVYLLRCADRSLYTGIARDPALREARHNAGRGAAYTRARRPVTLVYQEPATDRSAALRREYAIKQLSRSEKEALIMRPSPSTTPARATGGFGGFRPRALTFLRQLRRNNRKPWFEQHRAEYETEVRDPMRALVEEVDVGLARVAPEITGDPRRSVFRIHRDVRFSKDKSPYKTQAAAWFYHADAGKGVGTGAGGRGSTSSSRRVSASWAAASGCHPGRPCTGSASGWRRISHVSRRSCWLEDSGVASARWMRKRC